MTLEAPDQLALAPRSPPDLSPHGPRITPRLGLRFLFALFYGGLAAGHTRFKQMNATPFNALGFSSLPRFQ
jgi:hypothetical protein